MTPLMAILAGMILAHITVWAEDGIKFLWTCGETFIAKRRRTLRP
jgi:hypothetical protein